MNYLYLIPLLRNLLSFRECVDLLKINGNIVFYFYHAITCFGIIQYDIRLVSSELTIEI